MKTISYCHSISLFFLQMQELLDEQKRFVDSCQRVQLDDPTHVADVLDKLIDSLINKYVSLIRILWFWDEARSNAILL